MIHFLIIVLFHIVKAKKDRGKPRLQGFVAQFGYFEKVWVNFKQPLDV